jgi:hypothetical protein
MIQLLAASAVSRPIYYFTFGDATFAQQLNETVELLAVKRVTIGLFNLFYNKLPKFCIQVSCTELLLNMVKSMVLIQMDYSNI